MSARSMLRPLMGYENKIYILHLNTYFVNGFQWHMKIVLCTACDKQPFRHLGENQVDFSFCVNIPTTLTYGTS